MTIISYTLAKPRSGQRAKAEERARQLGAIYARHATSVRLVNFAAGANAGCIGLMRSAPDFATGVATYEAVNNDPAHTKFWQDAGADPSSDILVQRAVIRVVAGELAWDTHPITTIRRYEVGRDQLADMLALMPEVSALMADADVQVSASTPVLADDLSAMLVAYQARSLADWGRAMDRFSASEEFAAIVTKAGQFGTLRSASLMLPFD